MWLFNFIRKSQIVITVNSNLYQIIKMICINIGIISPFNCFWFNFVRSYVNRILYNVSIKLLCEILYKHCSMWLELKPRVIFDVTHNRILHYSTFVWSQEICICKKHILWRAPSSVEAWFLINRIFFFLVLENESEVDILVWNQSLIWHVLRQWVDYQCNKYCMEWWMSYINSGARVQIPLR